jgi:ribosomal-protein-alanine N-acetyltransferase
MAEEGVPRLPLRLGPYLLVRGGLRDVPAVARLEALVFPEPLGPGALLRLFADPRTRYLVARLHGRPVAYFGLQLFGRWAHVVSNATDPAHRGRGLASALLRLGEALARAEGARWIQGEVRASNAAQRRLLGRLGWRELGWAPGFFRNGEAAVVVARGLEPGPPEA